MTEVVLATANPDKAREVAEILEHAGIGVLPRPSTLGDVDETGDTLRDNALLKARAVAEATGAAAVADDTGLFVDALGGAPGVFSARYAGESATYAENVAKLLDALRDVPEPRRARFTTVAACVDASGRELVAEGTVEGSIALEPRGDAGFGYDPVFVPDELDGRTMAELSALEKHAISHRGRAFRALAARLTF